MVKNIHQMKKARAGVIFGWEMQVKGISSDLEISRDEKSDNSGLGRGRVN